MVSSSCSHLLYHKFMRMSIGFCELSFYFLRVVTTLTRPETLARFPPPGVCCPGTPEQRATPSRKPDKMQLETPNG
jgi:hypothetical protein